MPVSLRSSAQKSDDPDEMRPSRSSRRSSSRARRGGRDVSEVGSRGEQEPAARDGAPASPPDSASATRVSRLDFSDERSELERSQFHGFFNLAIMTGIIFVLNNSVGDLLSGKPILDNGELLSAMFAHRDFPVMVAGFVMMALFFCSAFLLQRLKVAFPSLPELVVYVVQHATQAIIILGSVGVAYGRDWPIVPTVAYVMQSIVMYMKMHSYIQTNRAMADERERMEAAGEAFDANSPEVYPNNVTFANFALFAFVPSLVYEPVFPRTPRVRWAYVVEKGMATFGAMIALYVLNVKYTIPVMKDALSLGAVPCILQLAVPFVVNYLVLFYIIFEGVCNGFAEVTRYADRNFFDDWWNSTTWDEYARKWNKPVHNWLLRHVYLHFRKDHKAPKPVATLVTFLFSALLHELLVACSLRVVRFYLSLLMLLQIPLIYAGALFKDTRFGNMVMWFGLLIGPAMLTTLYIRDAHVTEGSTIYGMSQAH